MKNNITIICPIHVWNIDVAQYTKKMITSLSESSNQNFDLLFVNKVDVQKEIYKMETKKWFTSHNTKFVLYQEDMNYQQVINYSQQFIDNDYFIVLEFDDTIHNMYLNTLQNHISHYGSDIDVYMNIVFEVNNNNDQLGMRNDYAWVVNAMDNIGYLSFNGVKNNIGPFSLVGAAINKDFYNKIGGLKPSIEISFNTEFILRSLNKGGVLYVVPQIGVKHTNGRSDSYFMQCANRYTNEEKNKWYKLALEQCYFTNV